MNYFFICATKEPESKQTRFVTVYVFSFHITSASQHHDDELIEKENQMPK